MDREKRRSDTPLPENLEEMLNEVQQQALPGIRYLGWEPRFLRKPMFQVPELVMQNTVDGKTGVLDADGSIRTLNIEIREHEPLKSGESKTGQSSSTTVTESDPVPAGADAEEKTLASLRAENEKLLAEVKKCRTAEARLSEQIKQQRGELCESAEKLRSLHAQVESDAVAMCSLQQQYASLKAKYSDLVEAHKLELEQLYQQPPSTQTSRIDS